MASDDAGLELFEVPLAQWHHWLFVNVDGNMPPLDAHFRFLDEKLAGYRIGAMAHAGALEFEIAANWKFVHENFIEPYHVFAAHPRLHTFVPMKERKPSFVEGHVLWNRYRFKHAQEGRGLRRQRGAVLSRPVLLNPMRCDEVEGMEREEGDALLDRLYAHCDQPRFEYSRRWLPGDVLIWDNRSALHQATLDIDPSKRRYLHRIMLRGDPPLLAV